MHETAGWKDRYCLTNQRGDAENETGCTSKGHGQKNKTPYKQRCFVKCAEQQTHVRYVSLSPLHHIAPHHLLVHGTAPAPTDDRRFLRLRTPLLALVVARTAGLGSPGLLGLLLHAVASLYTPHHTHTACAQHQRRDQSHARQGRVPFKFVGCLGRATLALSGFGMTGPVRHDTTRLDTRRKRASLFGLTGT